MYKIKYIDRWVWWFVFVAAAIVFVEMFSMAYVPRTSDVGMEVQTGNPNDYKEQPQTPPPVSASVVPQGLPGIFKFEGESYVFSSGPVNENVVFTGESVVGFNVYRLPEDSIPYGILFLEYDSRLYKYEIKKDRPLSP